MQKVIAFEFGVHGRLKAVCWGCFQHAASRGEVWLAGPGSPWLDAIDGNPVGVYLKGEKPPRPQCDDCGRALD